MDALEVWGGVECTVNRVDDTFYDQLQRSGHDRRLSDLDLIARLGIRRLRYPVLWESTAPHSPEERDWRWADARLQRLREFGIDPVVGLMHHGSGPRYTNLLDPGFPSSFAEYAGAVAARYPWIERYIPINEPLTTARFSALYGMWYPHRRDARSFSQAVIHQCKAVVLAMRAIREVNPNAQLIQTDDVGYTSSTARLAYQARFDNERRWLAWDLLCGMVGPRHPMWKYLRDNGVCEAELMFFSEHRCPPDVIGVNHYITSDRHLSEHLHLFPRNTWGGNGRQAYADCEAVRAVPGNLSGLKGALRDTWDRYRLPIAITEVHLGCTPDEQSRWLWEAWTDTQQLRASGMDLRAMTVWALLGSFDWNSLLTVDAGYYEAGAFDVSGPAPEATPLAQLIHEIATGAQPERLRLLGEPGWWRRPDRLLPSLRVSDSPAAAMSSMTASSLQS
jgi:dTDP-4-dehydrorhamnose reductase